MLKPASENTKKPFIDKHEAPYTACYCEENVYKLCEEFKSRVGHNEAQKNQTAYAVFITNSKRKCFVGHQQLGEFVCWDYHLRFFKNNIGILLRNITLKLFFTYKNLFIDFFIKFYIFLK